MTMLRWRASSTRSKPNSSITSIMQHVRKHDVISLLTSRASTIERVATRPSAAQNALEHTTEEVALPEAATPVLGERRVIRYRPIQTKPAEPPVGQIEMDLIAQPPLRSNAEAVANQEHRSSARDRSKVDRCCYRKAQGPA